MFKINWKSVAVIVAVAYVTYEVCSELAAKDLAEGVVKALDKMERERGAM